MCHVCEVEGLDWKFMNGREENRASFRTKLQRAHLFRVYRGRVAQLHLCHLHSIELFLVGELRFLEHHPSLCRELGSKQKKFLMAG